VNFTHALSTLILVLLFSTLAAFLQHEVRAQLVEEKEEAMAGPYVNEYSIPWENSGVMGIAVDSRGDVWFYMLNRSSIGRFIPSQGRFEEYPIEAKATASMGIALVAGGQFAFDERGRVWFTDALRNSIGVLDPSTGELKLYQIPTENSGPLGIIYDGMGSIWFAELYGNKIGRFYIQSESFEEYPLPSENSGPALLFRTSDGKIWFTESFGKRIGWIEPSKAVAGSSHGITEFTPEGLLSPVGIGVLNDVVWIADHGSSNVVAFFYLNGTVKVYPTSPAKAYPDSLPNQLIIDARGMVWFVQHVGNRIGVIDPNDGSMTEYVIPAGPLENTLWLAISLTGDIWFTKWTSNKIGVVRPLDRGFITIRVSEYTVDLRPGDSKELVIHLTSNISSALPVELRAISSKKGITYEIDQKRILLEPGKMHRAKILLHTDSNIEAGEYVVAVQAASDFIIQSKFISLRVRTSESFPVHVSTLTPLLLLAAGGVVLYLHLRHRRIMNRSKKDIRSALFDAAPPGDNAYAHFIIAPADGRVRCISDEPFAKLFMMHKKRLRNEY
jgi:virginiamycin B lyase